MLRKALSVAMALIALSSEGSAFDEITKLTTRDLAVATQKWKGKKVETVKPCVYVDVDDYRCGSARAHVFILGLFRTKKAGSTWRNIAILLRRLRRASALFEFELCLSTPITGCLSDNTVVLHLSRRRVTRQKFLRCGASD